MEGNLLCVAKAVRAQLDAFVALQAGLTLQPGFLNRLKRIFRPVDFNKVIRDARQIETELSNCLNSLSACPASNKAEQEFQQILMRYTAALADAVAKMIVTIESLWIKKQGKLTWETNTRLMREYQIAEQKYLDLGQTLNKCYREIAETRND